MKREKNKDFLPYKWVTCINCDHQYIIEAYALEPECSICGSKEFEDDGHEWGMGDYEY